MIPNTLTYFNGEEQLQLRSLPAAGEGMSWDQFDDPKELFFFIFCISGRNPP